MARQGLGDGGRRPHPLPDRAQVNDQAHRLSRAFDYPYEAPAHCYLFRDGDAARLSDAERARRRAGRTPVLAFGSNRAPRRLLEKFPQVAAAAAIPVERARLTGWDVVYAARFTTYGAVPAMVDPAPGTSVSVAVTWLDADQLAAMNASEGVPERYRLAVLEDATVRLADGTTLHEVHAYVSEFPALRLDGARVALAAIPAEGRRDPATTTGDLLRRLYALLRPDEAFEAFVLRLYDIDYRNAMIDRLGPLVR